MFTWSAKFTATGLIVDSSVTRDAQLLVSSFIVIISFLTRLSWISLELIGLD